MFVQDDTFELRDYQDKCVTAALDFARSRKQVRQMVNAPTGSGKTFVEVGYVLERANDGRNCLILANSMEQLNQTCAALERAGLDYGVEYDDLSAADNTGKVIVSTAQTMLSRMKQYPMDRFDDIVVDECHHSLAPGHRKVLEYFGALPSKNSKGDHTSLFGVTATPGKTAISEDLTGVFTDGVTADFDTRAAMESGILCNAECTIKKVGKLLDIHGIEEDAVARNLRDYDGKLISDMLEVTLKPLASDILEEGKDRKSIVFAPSVEFAKKLTKELRRQSRSTKIVELYSDTPSQERKTILEKFKKAKADSSYFLVNYSVAAEGFDSPSVNTIYNLRATKLPDLLTQMIGRGLRTDSADPDKKCKIISLDWFGKECCQPSLILSPNGLLNDMVTQEMRGGEYVDMLESINRNEKKFLLENESTYTVELSEAMRIAGVTDKGRQKFKKALLPDLREIRNAGVDVSKEIPYQVAHDLAEEIRRRKGLASLQQIDCLLHSGGFYYRDLWEITGREAEERIRIDGTRPTKRIRELLEKYGLDTNLAAEAFDLISQIRRTGIRPTGVTLKAEKNTGSIVRVAVRREEKKIKIIKKSSLEKSDANKSAPRENSQELASHVLHER